MNTISVERDGHIVEVRLQRPDKLNAQTHEMWFELRQVGSELGQDASIRALVVSGEGRSFSAGLDTAVLSGLSRSAAAPDLEGLSGPAWIRRIQESFTWLTDTPYPTVAAVQGHALGAGFQPALACDLRVAGDDARFGLLETNWGLMPDLGGTVWPRREWGRSAAFHRTTCSKRVSPGWRSAHPPTPVPDAEMGMR